MENIDSTIKDLIHKQSTADNLNSIGDLYLKKGDKEKAIEYYFESIEKSLYLQKEKKIAMFKKIINIDPFNEKAYEGIIEIVSKMGFISEEVKYLTLLGEIYNSKGYSDKAGYVFKRIKEINPQNRIADDYLKQKKQKLELEEKNDYAQRGDLKPEKIKITSPNEDFVDKDKIRVRDRAEKGLFTASLEEFVEKRKPSITDKSKQKERPLKVYIFTGAAIIIVITVFAYLIFSKDFDSIRVIQKNSQSNIWLNNKATKSSNFEISISMMSDEIINESGIQKVISGNDIMNNQFYVVSIKAVKGCLPKEFVLYPYRNIFFLRKDGTPYNIVEINGLNHLNKTIYRTDILGCGNFNAVFQKVFVYHSNKSYFAGLSVIGLERDNSITIKW